MRDTITISLPRDLRKALDRVTKEQGGSRSDVVRESLRRYLVVRRFRELRARLVPKARAMGIFTDEDVFKRLS
jgi:metal-responsive CopG/Arc/MetJ family transcriptional regulator